jgi:hypothetical protein
MTIRGVGMPTERIVRKETKAPLLGWGSCAATWAEELKIAEK